MYLGVLLIVHLLIFESYQTTNPQYSVPPRKTNNYDKSITSDSFDGRSLSTFSGGHLDIF